MHDEVNYNYSKLRGRLRELGLTQLEFAKKIGISECSLNLALNNKRGFRQGEILRAISALKLENKDIDTYFFVHEL